MGTPTDKHSTTFPEAVFPMSYKVNVTIMNTRKHCTGGPASIWSKWGGEEGVGGRKEA